jgi:hypothetical protein
MQETKKELRKEGLRNFLKGLALVGVGFLSLEVAALTTVALGIVGVAVMARGIYLGFRGVDGVSKADGLFTS